MQLRYLNYLGLILILFFSACTASFDIDTDDSEPIIVIYGCLTDEQETQKVRITTSSPYFDNKTNDFVENAIVTITDSEGAIYPMSYSKEGYYESDDKFTVLENITYNLKVEVDFDKDGVSELYEASTTVSPVIPVDSIDIKYMDIMGYGHYALNIFMQDPPEQENYYMFRFMVNDSLSNYKISELMVSSDELYNGSYLKNITIVYLEDGNDEDNIKQSEDSDNKMYLVYPGDKVAFQVINIEKGYYNFIRECISEKRGENPFFGGPPSNITTNISNGGVGYFTSYKIFNLFTTVPN